MALGPELLKAVGVTKSRFPDERIIKGFAGKNELSRKLSAL